VLEFFLACLLSFVVKVKIENDVETNTCKYKATKRLNMLTVLHQDLVIVVVYNSPSESTRREEGQEFRVVLECIVCSIWVLLLLLFFLIVLCLVEMRLSAESCTELVRVLRGLLRSLLLVLCWSIFIEVFLISVLEELIVLSLIIGSELRFLPLFKVFPCPFITLIHILPCILFPLLLFMFLFGCLPLSVHIV
jgi:hypothetical protein